MKDNNLIIFGNTNFSQLIAEYIKKFTNYNIICFTVDKKYIKEKTILKIPVVEFENIEKKYNPSNYKFIVCIGYNKMNSIREDAFSRIKNKGYEIINFIHPNTCITVDNMGTGNIFLENVIIGPHSKIGDGNIFWNGANICHDTIIGNFNQISAGTTIAGCTKIKNNCFLGINCSIKDGVTIANKTLVGAGCYINDDTLENEVYVPAKAVKLNKKSDEIKISN